MHVGQFSKRKISEHQHKIIKAQRTKISPELSWGWTECYKNDLLFLQSFNRRIVGKDNGREEEVVHLVESEKWIEGTEGKLW